MLALLMAYQALVGEAGARLIESDFDLGRAEPAADADTIVVTGRRRPDPRHVALPERRAADVPRADIPLLGDTHLSLDVEQGEVANAPSNRAMIRLKVPF